MNRHVWLLAILQGLFLTNNVAFIAMNGLVGFQLAPVSWMATLPVMGYVVGGALSTPLVTRSQQRWGRKGSFRLGLLTAFVSTLLGALAVYLESFWGLMAVTVVAGYFNANAQLYRFAAAEVAPPHAKEKAVSWVMAGGLLGAIAGPNLTQWTRALHEAPFVGTYLSLAAVAIVAWLVLELIAFPASAVAAPSSSSMPSSAWYLLKRPTFLAACLCAALSYGVMNLLMAATPLAMKVCEMPFSDTAMVLQWHVIGMFAPGFVTGHLIKRLGAIPVMLMGVALNLACIAIAFTSLELSHFLAALTLLGVGWNFLFTASTTLAIDSYEPHEKNQAQGLITLCTFSVTALSSFASGALVTEQGWHWLNLIALGPVVVMAIVLVHLYTRRIQASNP